MTAKWWLWLETTAQIRSPMILTIRAEAVRTNQLGGWRMFAPFPPNDNGIKAKLSPKENNHFPSGGEPRAKVVDNLCCRWNGNHSQVLNPFCSVLKHQPLIESAQTCQQAWGLWTSSCCCKDCAGTPRTVDVKMLPRAGCNLLARRLIPARWFCSSIRQKLHLIIRAGRLW